MQVEFVSNASLVIRAGGVTILTDPWYSPGIYYGTWYPFPPLSEADLARYKGLKPDAIYISHIHPDHLDVDTLRAFEPDTPILIGKLPHPHLERSIKSLGFSDLRVLPFGEAYAFKGLTLTILGPFHETSEGFVDAVDYDMDTSLIVQDGGGRQLLNINDNPIKPDDAEALNARYGTFDLAILPYGGASSYPHAFPQYDALDKRERTEALSKRMLARLVKLGKILEPKVTLPAAGSYVHGGATSRHNPYLHQACPDEIEAAWSAAIPETSQCIFPLTGDIFDASGCIHRVADHPYRGYDALQREAYGKTLAANPLSHEEVSISADFRVPWPRLLFKARANLWRMQQRLELTPAVDLTLHIVCSDVLGSAQPPERFAFALDSEGEGRSEGSEGERVRMSYTIDERLLLMVLIGAAHWNNIEIGALVDIERDPDVFNPTIHSLMSFFTL